ncbi:DNA methyltransferase [Paracoccus sp. SSK6]|uniref:DNA methyltransferase n=1 Tax=Paracoccus sp. SSK6 TaxID=3143131 RepID=UPI00321A59D1
MSNFDVLVAKLREIFQIDRPDLDFGVYRILRARAGEIEDYLSKRLKARVAEALAAGAAANTEALKTAIAKARDAAEAAGYDPDKAPKVLSLQKELAAASARASEHENQVFSHLLTFFSRYWDRGDFISQRRYKGDTYAIPYSGEEVVLHWANRDQYYTKSSEAFSNFSFKLDDGRAVHFRLVAADTAKDNRKDNDKERRFVLAKARTLTRTDEDGETYEETIQPVAEEDGALVIRFDYVPQPKGTKQEALVDQAVTAILGDEAVKARWLALTNRAPTDKKPNRTLLEKHLTTYTQKNTADYFIHKDLGGFLRRELDFYIKNEVMNLDDVQGAEAFAAIEKSLRMIQCLRAIALDLVTFLASIENFQKKLWLKKKFVVAAHYCVTLDRVPQELYPAIVANPAQWGQWNDLGMRGTAAPGTVEDLKGAPFLMVDTALFDAGFRADLLKAIPDLDASLDGLLVHGDNFQALTLLKETHSQKVNCVYIDPPYNAQSSEINYKNSYRNSSWLSLMENRLLKGRQVSGSDAVTIIAIDEVEQEYLGVLLDTCFADMAHDCITIVTNPSGQQGDNFSAVHDYAYFVHPQPGRYIAEQHREDPADWDERNFRDVTGDDSLRKSGKNCFYPIIVKDGSVIGFGEVSPEEYHPQVNEPGADGTILVYPVDPEDIERKWRFARHTVEQIKDELKVHWLKKRGVWDIKRLKKRFNFKTVWSGARYSANNHGTQLLNHIVPNAETKYPKSLYTVVDSLSAGLNGNRNGLVLDYFCGSGTTAHATITLNRDDSGHRKYILAEQGAYVYSVVIPRIKKVVYSSDWKDGKPTAPETGISHAFKVLKIEGYEDTLNNLDLKRSDAQASLLDGFSAEKRDDYLMRYMLDVEAKGSLLSVSDFRKPFDYTLKVAVDSAGAWEERRVDLVETFNYLIGLTVRHIDIQHSRGFVTVEGWLPTGEKTLILWRDCEKIGYEKLTRLCDKLAINPADSEFDVVYINGDHNIPSVVETTEEEGSVIKKLMLRQIEPAFLDAMFNVDDV